MKQRQLVSIYNENRILVHNTITLKENGKRRNNVYTIIFIYFQLFIGYLIYGTLLSVMIYISFVRIPIHIRVTFLYKQYQYLQTFSNFYIGNKIKKPISRKYSLWVKGYIIAVIIMSRSSFENSWYGFFCGNKKYAFPFK